ncbi:hypothetical protein Tco_1442873 [Tanacetum coccineum]
MQKNPIFHISVDISNIKRGIYSCQIDEQWFTLNANLLRKVLEITPVDTTNPFEPPPAREAVMDFVN